MEPDYQLRVIIAAGPEDATRAILGLAMADSACGIGTRVGVYFAMNGAQACSIFDFGTRMGAVPGAVPTVVF